jgi:hypothetical protein
MHQPLEPDARPARTAMDRHALVGVLAVVAVVFVGLPGCSFCPAGLEPTAADKAAGLACHFTPAQEQVWEQREWGLRHPAPSSF